MARGGIELLLGFALGYLALTDEGRTMGNKLADAALKGGKAVIRNHVKKPDSGIVPQEKEEKRDNH